MDDWLYQHGNWSIAKLRPGEFTPLTSPLLDAKINDYFYVPDEIRYHPWKFNTKKSDDSGLIIRLYDQRFSAERYEFCIDKVMHSTNEVGYKGITGADGQQLLFKTKERWYNIGVQGNETVLKTAYTSKQLDPTCKASANLVWFTPYIDTERKENYLKFLQQRQMQIRRKWALDGIGFPEHYLSASDFHRHFYCTTKPFGFVPHGPAKMMEYDHALVFNFNDLLAKYRSIVGSQSLYATLFGTEVYSQEIMHAVIIHPPVAELSEQDRKILLHSPRMGQRQSMDTDTILFHPNKPDPSHASIIYDAKSRTSGKWFWKPYSTASKFTYEATTEYTTDRKSRWDHPAFAFLLPEKIKCEQEADSQGFDFGGLYYKPITLKNATCQYCNEWRHQWESCDSLVLARERWITNRADKPCDQCGNVGHGRQRCGLRKSATERINREPLELDDLVPEVKSIKELMSNFAALSSAAADYASATGDWPLETTQIVEKLTKLSSEIRLLLSQCKPTTNLLAFTPGIFENWLSALSRTPINGEYFDSSIDILQTCLSSMEWKTFFTEYSPSCTKRLQSAEISHAWKELIMKEIARFFDRIDSNAVAELARLQSFRKLLSSIVSCLNDQNTTTSSKSFMFSAAMKIFGHLALLYPEERGEESPLFLSSVLNLFRQPTSGLRLAAGNMLKILAAQPWAQTAMAQQAGIINFLLDRTTETTYEGLQIKYDIIKLLLESPTLDQADLERLKKYVDDGAFVEKAQPPDVTPKED